jgi:hypothetical protein
MSITKPVEIGAICSTRADSYVEGYATNRAVGCIKLQLADRDDPHPSSSSRWVAGS